MLIINLDKHIQSCSSSSQSIELEDGIIEGEEIRHFLFLKRTKTNELSKKKGSVSCFERSVCFYDEDKYRSFQNKENFKSLKSFLTRSAFSASPTLTLINKYKFKSNYLNNLQSTLLQQNTFHAIGARCRYMQLRFQLVLKNQLKLSSFRNYHFAAGSLSRREFWRALVYKKIISLFRKISVKKIIKNRNQLSRSSLSQLTRILECLWPHFGSRWRPSFSILSFNSFMFLHR